MTRKGDVYAAESKNASTSSEYEMQPLLEQTWFTTATWTALRQQDLSLWPGLAAYRKYLLESFKPLLTNHYADVWNSLGLQIPKRIEDCWMLFEIVVKAVYEVRAPDSDCREIWKHIIAKQTADPDERQTSHPYDELIAANVVFAILCWSTLLIEPRVGSDVGDVFDFRYVDSQKHKRYRSIRSEELVERPVYRIFESIKQTMQVAHWRWALGTTVDDESNGLYEPSLSFSSLSLICQVRIVWVNAINDHLHFDASNRELSIFRFPSLCAALIQADKGMPGIMTRSIAALIVGYDGDSDAPCALETTRMFQEILVSYRLLFGQARASRKLMKMELKGLRKAGESCDVLLDTLCCHRTKSREVRSLSSDLWPSALRDIRGFLLQPSSYSPIEDFPLFGQRLARLQEFSMRQQPRALLDLWRDRRNPLQWYTFWVVAIVGGIGLLLAGIQVLLGILQVWYNAKAAVPCSSS